MTRAISKRTYIFEFKRDFEPRIGCKVIKGDDKYIVKMERAQCMCKMWNLTSIPYTHAMCVIWVKS